MVLCLYVGTRYTNNKVGVKSLSEDLGAMMPFFAPSRGASYIRDHKLNEILKRLLQLIK